MKFIFFIVVALVAHSCLADFSGWKLVKQSSSHDFADMAFQGDAQTGESLQIIAVKNPQVLIQLEKNLLAGFEGETREEVRDNEGELFLIRDVRVTSPQTLVPSVAILTAIQKTKFDHHVGIQFILKPHCEKCLNRIEGVKKHFANAQFDESGTHLFLAGRDFDLSNLVFSKEIGWCERTFGDFKTTLVTAAVGLGSILFFTMKVCGGIMGYNGPCGNNLAVCKCGNM